MVSNISHADKDNNNISNLKDPLSVSFQCKHKSSERQVPFSREKKNYEETDKVTEPHYCLWHVFQKSIPWITTSGKMSGVLRKVICHVPFIEIHDEQ